LFDSGLLRIEAEPASERLHARYDDATSFVAATSPGEV
jgi:hypothetical protein